MSQEKTSSSDEEYNSKQSCRRKAESRSFVRHTNRYSSDSENNEDERTTRKTMFERKTSINNGDMEQKNHRKRDVRNSDESRCVVSRTNHYSSDSENDEDESHSKKKMIERTKSRNRDDTEERNLRKSYDWDKNEFSVLDLVSILSKTHNFKVDIFDVMSHMEKMNMPSNHLKVMLNKNPQSFHIDKGEVRLQPDMKVCNAHNFDGCRSRQKCNDLHICMDYISDNCSSQTCLLGHKWDTDHNSKVLHYYHLQSVDHNILKQLVYNYLKFNKYSNKQPIETSKSKSRVSMSSDESSDDGKGNQNPGAKSSRENYITKSKSVWSCHEEGNVKVDEICYYSVENKCKFETEGCSRLHSGLHFHWQISKEGNKWLNLPKQVVIKLEIAYCDPKNDGLELSKVDIAKNSVIYDILGSSSWKLNFDTLLLKSKNKSLHLRRLCSERVRVLSKNVQSYNYIWYFLNDTKKWIQYGKYDSQNYFTCETNSQHIEFEFQKYLRTNTKNVMLFNNNMFTYCIDFDKMNQTNLKTKVIRKVRRRPELDIKYQNVR